MKHIIYILVTMLFLGLVTGCNENGTPSGNQEVVSTAELPSNTTDDVTDPTVVSPVDQEDHVTEAEEENIISTMKLFPNPDIDKILLRWDTVNNVTGYLLEWNNTQDNLANSTTLGSDKTQYLHQDLEPETIYYYRITAQFRDEQRNVSSEVVAVKTGSVIQIIQSDVAY